VYVHVCNHIHTRDQSAGRLGVQLRMVIEVCFGALPWLQETIVLRASESWEQETGQAEGRHGHGGSCGVAKREPPQPSWYRSLQAPGSRHSSSAAGDCRQATLEWLVSLETSCRNATCWRMSTCSVMAASSQSSTSIPQPLDSKF
jgi:hypothetical protein